MSSKSFLSLKISRLIFLLLCALSFQPLLRGQEKKWSEMPWEDLVQIRLWNMLLPPGPKLRITLKRDAEEGPINVEANWQEFTGYCAVVPKKSFTLSVEDVSNGKEVGKVQFSADKGQYFTILAKPSATKGIDLSVINDSFKYSSDMPGRFTIFQFVPGYQVKATAAGEGVAREATYANGLVFDDLPMNTQVKMQVTRLKDGKVMEKNFDLNFKDSKHVACLLVLDPYERFTVRTVAEGYTFTIIEAPEPAQPAPTAEP